MSERRDDDTPAAPRRFRPYPAYKPSGVDWLGEIPEHWDVKKLKYGTNILMGQSPSSDTYDNENAILPFLQGNAEFSEKHPIAQKFCDAAVKIAPKGALLLSVRAPVGALNIADQNYGIGRGLCGVIVKPGALSRSFLWYLIHIIKEELFSQATGSTYEAVSADEVSSLLTLFPPIEEQTAIAAFLERETAKIDALVAKKERLIELLEERRAALISRAVTRGLDPDAPLKPSGVDWLGEIPKGWEVLPLKRLSIISYGLGLELDRTETEGTYILSLPNVTLEGILNLSEVPKTRLSDEEKETLLLKKGDLLFNWRSGSPEHVGKTAYFDQDGEYTHVSFLLRLRFNSNEHDSRYFRYFLNNLRSTGFFSSSKFRVNTTFNQTELRDLAVMVPPVDEQSAIAAFLDRETAKIDALVAKVREGIEKLKEYRTALISAAVTGKIDVREEVTSYE
ncbi:MAG: restriction endonuclease subunit S [Candidatus Zixiibacteriota bacterium]